MNHFKANQIIILFFVLFISAIFFAMIRFFLMAIFLAAIFSALAMPVFNRFERWLKGKKNLSAGLTMFTLFLIVVLPLGAVLGIVVTQAFKISRTAVPWVQQQIPEPTIFDQQLRTLPFYADIEVYREQILQKAGELAGKTASALLGALSSITYSAVADLFLLFVFLYTLFFFLRDGRMILDKAISFLPLSVSDEQRLLDRFLSVTRATLKGTVVVGFVQGSLAGTALYLAGIENALFWGTIMSLLSLIPFVGSALIWFPSAVYLAVTGQYIQAGGVFLFCSVVVGQIDNIIRPILIGRDTRMHELLIFFGTLGGIALFGVFGFIVGPIVAALFMTVWEIYGETFSDFLLEIKNGQNR
ncbi:MAG: AI-2E family transporter [Chlorobiaceae bacterium]|nr:AI-2E family transporter [Chlorobiaceae bacterium]NTW10172.1 AI-2E family transporter [Chlorobiaceae bacterium]